MHTTHDLTHEFHGLVDDLSLRAPRPRCADGHGTLTHLFFSDAPLDIARAKAICGRCELASTCLSGALDRHEPWGVWGGELVENGRIAPQRRPRGRPPRVPRPALEVDEVPLPPTLVALPRPAGIDRVCEPVLPAALRRPA